MFRKVHVLSLCLLLTVTFLFIGAATANASPYSDEVAADNPIAWWRMDDATDSAGTHDGTAGPGVSFDRAGAIYADPSLAAAFPGASDGVITVADATDLNFGDTQDFSIECWVKRDDMSVHGVILNKGDTNGSYWLIFNNDGKLRFNLDYGTTNTEAKTAEAYDDGMWHHVVGVADRSESVKLYVDGELKATKQLYGVMDVSSEGQSLQIGYMGTGSFWQGNIDEFAIYDHAATATQIYDRYQAGIGASGSYSGLVSAASPVGWWRMDDASDLADSHDGTAGAGVAFNQTGAISGDSSLAAVFDGTSDASILVDDATDLNFGENTEFTVEGWFTREDELPAMNICNKGDTNGAFWVRMESSGELRFMLDYGDYITEVRTGENTYDDGAYHYFAAVADLGTAVQLYVDGSLVVEVDPYAPVGSVSSEGQNLILGTFGTGALPLLGVADEVSLYGTALTDAQVLAHYQAGVPEPSTIVLLSGGLLMALCALSHKKVTMHLMLMHDTSI